jgi:hypothetical protein
VSANLVEPIDWKEIEALLVQSYRLVALKRMLVQLDGQTVTTPKGKRRG